MRVKELFAFIRERHAIYERRAAGQPKPWTKDKILQSYRFCNIYRELNTVTIWIRKNWREPNAMNPDVWFAMMVSRLLNLPDALDALDVRRHVLHWDPKSFKKILRIRKEAGEKIFNAAYMIHADAVVSGLKTDYLADYVLTPAWENRAELRPRKSDTLALFHERIMSCRDMGSFMAAQVVADTKFTGPLKKAEDWWTWAAMGPGSARGLARVVGNYETVIVERIENSARGPEKRLRVRWREADWMENFRLLLVQILPLAREARLPRLCAQDLQNCLCEFDKYERVRLGEGRPKQLYPGAA